MKSSSILSYLGFAASFASAHPVSREASNAATADVYQLGAVV